MSSSILTTHVGSLPRSKELSELLFAKDKRENFDQEIFNYIVKKNVEEVVKSGILSQYLGCWHDDFYGGTKVQEFERECEKYFNVKHAITVNSWTSGLIAAFGSIGINTLLN